MNRWMMKALVAACVWAVGCGGGNGPEAQGLKGSAVQGGGDTGSGSGGGSGGDTSSNPGSAAERSLELRLQGMDAGGLESLFLRVKGVEVRANGMVDLTVANNAFLLTTFKAPAGVEEVEVAVALDSATAVMPKESFDVDLQCEVIRLNAKVKLLEQRHHAVIFLDLARSLGKVGTNMAFAPHLHLVY